MRNVLVAALLLIALPAFGDGWDFMHGGSGGNRAFIVGHDRKTGETHTLRYSCGGALSVSAGGEMEQEFAQPDASFRDEIRIVFWRIWWDWEENGRPEVFELRRGRDAPYDHAWAYLLQATPIYGALSSREHITIEIELSDGRWSKPKFWLKGFKEAHRGSCGEFEDDE